MKDRKYSIKFLLFRIACCLISGILASMALLGAVDTYSWFSDTMLRGSEVSAASTDDILAKYDVVYDGHGNAKEIILQRKADLNYDPILFFAVKNPKGEKQGAADYILHINPVRLDVDQETGVPKIKRVPIVTDVNLVQFLNLLESNKEVFEGTLKIKYLNGFINVQKPIAFQKTFLIKQFAQEIEKSKAREHKVNMNPEVQQSITQIITYVAKHRDWEEVHWEKDTNSQQILQTVRLQDLVKTPMQAKEEKEQNASIETIESLKVEKVINPITRLTITEEQTQIMNLLVPKLTAYLDEIYETVEALVKDINDKLKEIAALTHQLAQLEQEKANIEKEKADIEKENKELKRSNEDLQKRYDELLEQYNRLGEKNDALRSRMSDLKTENEALQMHRSSGGTSGGGSVSEDTTEGEEIGSNDGEEGNAQEDDGGTDEEQDNDEEEGNAQEDDGGTDEEQDNDEEEGNAQEDDGATDEEQDNDGEEGNDQEDDGATDEEQDNDGEEGNDQEDDGATDEEQDNDEEEGNAQEDDGGTDEEQDNDGEEGNDQEDDGGTDEEQDNDGEEGDDQEDDNVQNIHALRFRLMIDGIVTKKEEYSV